MPRRKYRYQMYQPKHCSLIDAENKQYRVKYEEAKWTLDEGMIDWYLVSDPLEFSSENMDESLRIFNIENIEYIIQDYKHITKKMITALNANSTSADKLRYRREWCYHKWIEFETLFDQAGWNMDVETPEIFRFQPTPNYTTIAFGVEIVHLTPIQGKVIMILHINYLNGIYSLTTQQIFDQLQEANYATNATKLSQIFDNKKKREILIKEVSKGVYSLNMPPI